MNDLLLTLLNLIIVIINLQVIYDNNPEIRNQLAQAKERAIQNTLLITSDSDDDYVNYVRTILQHLE